MTTTEMMSLSLKNYLEAIFHIVGEKEAVQDKDIAQRLGMNHSSVTGALRIPAKEGLINYPPNRIIMVTSAAD